MMSRNLVFNCKKKAVVYLDEKQIFKNLKNIQSFKNWWKEFRKEYRDDLFAKLKSIEAEKRFIKYMVIRESENPATRKWDNQLKNE